MVLNKHPARRAALKGWALAHTVLNLKSPQKSSVSVPHAVVVGAREVHYTEGKSSKGQLQQQRVMK
jgi:hypothetical protein